MLFDAVWIHCAGAAPPADVSIAWETGPHDGMTSDDVVVLCGHARGAVVARAIANLASGVVGLSNVVASDGWLDETWRSVVSAVQDRFPGTPVVGYEEGSALACAVRHGFDAIGPVRIWMRPA